MWITLDTSGWDLLGDFAAAAFGFIGLPLTLMAATLLALPRWRKRARWRWTALAVVLVTVALGLRGAGSIATSLRGWLYDLDAPRRLQARTHRLTKPTAFGGVTFPAGAVVVLNEGEDGPTAHVHLARPASILGLPLIGDLRMAPGVGGAPMVAEGVLAAPVDVAGQPCGAGPFEQDEDETTCVLGVTWRFNGHLLAAGQAAAIHHPAKPDAPELRQATLGAEERLDGHVWPRGVVLTDEQTDAQGRPERLEICVPDGLSVALPFGTLHGPLSYAIEEDGRRISDTCFLKHGQTMLGGFVEVGGQRFRSGQKGSSSSSWNWAEN